MGLVDRIAPLGVAFALALTWFAAPAAADLPVERSLAMALSAEREAMRGVSSSLVSRVTAPQTGAATIQRYDASYLMTLPAPTEIFRVTSATSAALPKLSSSTE